MIIAVGIINEYSSTSFIIRIKHMFTFFVFYTISIAILKTHINRGISSLLAGRAAFGGVVLASMAFVKRKRPC